MTNQQKLYLIFIYSSSYCKPKDEREKFYEQLQTVLNEIPNEGPLILMADFNARIRNEVVSGVK